MPCSDIHRRYCSNTTARPRMTTKILMRSSAYHGFLRNCYGQCTPPRKICPAAEFSLNPQQLVVLGDAVRARHRTGLDLARRSTDGKVRDRRILGLARAMRDDGYVVRLLGHANGRERLSDGADLVQRSEE